MFQALLKMWELIGKYGVGTYLLFFVGLIIVFSGFIVYKRLKGIGFLDGGDNFAKVIKDGTELFHKTVKALEDSINTLAKGNEKVFNILEKGYLKAEHTEIVREFAYGKSDDLKSSIIRSVMELYENHLDNHGDFKEQDNTKRILKNEVKAAILRIDAELFKLPNVEGNTPSTDKKYDVITGYTDTIINIMTTERRKGNIRDRVSSIISNLIITNRF